ncbi:uncharacterized protein MEPE_04781 [Melanopsichium pennsylvanicum]|uniref:Uncharacterized protein n=2 Tax=Melanopsichium pennsylvanicum TaxID=63383 RepID=A0AAJ5C6P5_9BASI|nr:putative protein [Melanopsichium pennsylvanicum 4]SNX86072.1 uncharacterized protein MEPE_04781 [Melanopsichium pennsylvanicum]
MDTAALLASKDLYAHAYPPPYVPISIATAEGPYLILIFALTLLFGVNLALYAMYLHLFCSLPFFSSGHHARDPVLLQLAVFICVACNAILAILGFIAYYHASLIELYSEKGFNVNKIEWFVPVYHILQAIPEAIGQIYFTLRIARLFNARLLSTRFALIIAFIGILAQFVIMTWLGAAFLNVGYKSHLLVPSIRLWIKGIILAWVLIFVALELAMTITTLVRLVVLRRQTRMDAARRVIFNLAVYSLHGQVLLSGSSLACLYLFDNSVEGWYTPMYLVNGALYTAVMLANLNYRVVVAGAMKQAQSEYSPSSDEERKAGRAQGFRLDQVRTVTEPSTSMTIVPEEVHETEHNEEDGGQESRDMWRRQSDTVIASMFNTTSQHQIEPRAQSQAHLFHSQSGPQDHCGNVFSRKDSEEFVNPDSVARGFKRGKAKSPMPLVLITTRTSLETNEKDLNF